MTERVRRATYDDVLSAPENMVAELIDGVLYTQSRPASRHARASSRLGAELGGPFDRGKGGPGGWILLDEPELHAHDDVLVPDIAGWRRERMPEMPITVGFELPPDWVVEVLSPSTQALDRVKKRAVYAREGVEWLWFVDPIAKTLEVFRLQEQTWIVHSTFEGDAPVRAAPFDAIALEMAALWEL